MFIKEAYIRQIGPNKFRVYSKKGKNMGTFSSRSAAKERLKDIEFFKRVKKFKSSAVDGFSPIRVNLDYGERDSVLKKRLSKLKSTRSALESLGLKKEASILKNNSNALLLNAFLTLMLLGGGLYLTNRSLEGGYLKQMVADFSLEESPNLREKKIEVDLGTPVEDIISRVYPDISLDNKRDIILQFLEEYNPNLSFSEGKVSLKREESFKHTHRAEVAYPDLQNVLQKFSERLPSGYQPSEVGKAGELQLSPEGVQLMIAAEGFIPTIYNDNESFVWPRDKDNPTAKGHWTIGYGHLLTEPELKSGIISIPGKKISWENGISKEDGLLIKKNDLVKHSVLKAGMDPNLEITRGMYDALTDLSFNIGTEGLAQVLRESKDSSGGLNSDLLIKEIAGRTRVSNPDQEKGILVRRISQILLAKNILLPSKPKKTMDFFSDPNLQMSMPDKEKVLEYLKYFNKKNSKLEKAEVRSVLQKLAETPPSTFQDFVLVLDQTL